MKRITILLALTFCLPLGLTSSVACDNEDSDSEKDDDDDDDGDDDDGDDDDDDGGDDDGDDDGDGDGDGDDDDGDGDGDQCERPSDCDTVVCDCESGPVNVKDCYDGVCSDDSVCPDVCAGWDDEEEEETTGW